MSVTAASAETADHPESAAPAVGGVRATWWNAVFSLAVAVVAAHIPVVLFLLGGLSGSAWGAADAVPSTVQLVLVGLVGAVSLAAQLVMIPWLRPGLGGGIASWPVAAAAVVSGATVWAVITPEGIGVLPLVSALSMVACASPAAVRRPLFVVAVLAAVIAWIATPGVGRVPAVMVISALYPYLVFASVWAWDVVTRLDRARATEADLAVTRERLRFASDLHDIQGHSLQVIALKSELAERLLSLKPEAAAVQIAEVRMEAADALARTRELARGYRATSIEAELDNARDVLTVAGFDCTVEVLELPRDIDIRALFGRVLREATTNVLRHAEEGPVRIEVGRGTAANDASSPRGDWRLQVTNHVTATDRLAEMRGDGVRDGAGLAGLADRASRLGGKVDAGLVDDDDNDDDVASTFAEAAQFVLTVTVPQSVSERNSR